MVVSIGINERLNIIIPSDAIRFRIIGNSDDFQDQELKLRVKGEVEKELYNIIGDSKDSEEAKNKIKNNLNKVNNIVDKYNVEYDIKYGNNYFPEKVYKGVTYKEGNYESLVITLGDGLGKNWWCVLFPPLCLLDENNNYEDYEYELYVSKLINKFTK